MSAAARKLPWRSAAAASGIVALVAVSRIFARPRTFWEWDDYIFGLALHLFAPQSSVPQPPFFPAFIHAARLANRFLHDDVAALTGVSVVSSGAAAAFVYAIARELALGVRVAASAAVLFAFFPASWFFAGTPLSDAAGVAATLAAIALSLRSYRRPSSILAAAAVLGLAIGVRPQTAFIAFVAFAAASVRNRRLAAAAAGVAALSTAVCWAVPVVSAAGGIGPILHPFLRQWRHTVGETSPLASRFPLGFVLRRWLIDSWGSPIYAAAAGIAVVGGVAVLPRKEDPAFLPAVGIGTALYVVCGILFLDVATTGRYMFPAMPAAAIAAAAGLAAVESRFRLPRGGLTALFAAASVALVGPALFVMRTRPSPPVEAAARIRAEAGGRPFAIVYPAEMYVPAELLFPGVPKYEAGRTPSGTLAASAVPVWRFGVSSFGGEEAAWPPLAPFFTLGMGRYVRVPYGRWRPEPEFGAGWYGEERDGAETFRWMGNTGEILLPPCSPPARLDLALVAPLEELGGPPQVELSFNGVVLDRRRLDARRTELSYRIDAGVDAASENRLRLTTTRVFNPRRAGKGSDDRDLGLEIRRLRWGPDRVGSKTSAPRATSN